MHDPENKYKIICQKLITVIQKYIIITTLLFYFSPTLAQSNTWGTWMDCRDVCLKGLDMSTRWSDYGAYGCKSNERYVEIRFRNRYKKTIHFNFAASNWYGNKDDFSARGRMSLKPQESGSTYMAWCINTSRIKVWIDCVCLGKDTYCSTNEYYSECTNVVLCENCPPRNDRENNRHIGNYNYNNVNSNKKKEFSQYDFAGRWTSNSGNRFLIQIGLNVTNLTQNNSFLWTRVGFNKYSATIYERSLNKYVTWYYTILSENIIKAESSDFGVSYWSKD